MTLNNNIVIADSVFAQEVDDEIVILDTVSEEYFGLDEMAAVIWQHLSESGSLQKAHDAMSEVYDVDPQQLEKDICSFTQELVDAGLVQLQA
jgi:hypothetical protein